MIYAVVGIILFILILCAPVRAAAEFEGKSAAARVTFWGIPIYVWKNEKKGADNREPAEKVKDIEKKTEKLSAKIKRFISLCRTAVKLTKQYTEMEKATVDIQVGTGEAASTAVCTGILWAAVYGFLGMVGKVFPIIEHNVAINPDYGKSIFSAKGKCIIKSRMVYIIIIAITILIKIHSFKEE